MFQRNNTVVGLLGSMSLRGIPLLLHPSFQNQQSDSLTYDIKKNTHGKVLHNARLLEIFCKISFFWMRFLSPVLINNFMENNSKDNVPLNPAPLICQGCFSKSSSILCRLLVCTIKCWTSRHVSEGLPQQYHLHSK